LVDPVVVPVPVPVPVLADEEAVEMPAGLVLELLHAASSRAATVASGTTTAIRQRILGAGLGAGLGADADADVGVGVGAGRPEDLRPPKSVR
jgi:hypothetical protein